MDDIKISNSIYISFATLEVIIILFLKTTNSIAYSGIIWILPLFLIVIPIYRTIKKYWKE